MVLQQSLHTLLVWNFSVTSSSLLSFSLSSAFLLFFPHSSLVSFLSSLLPSSSSPSPLLLFPFFFPFLFSSSASLPSYRHFVADSSRSIINLFALLLVSRTSCGHSRSPLGYQLRNSVTDAIIKTSKKNHSEENREYEKVTWFNEHLQLGTRNKQTQGEGQRGRRERRESEREREEGGGETNETGERSKGK